jgi:glycosyltransferase involved in cell wall biosynthesis
MVRVLFVYGAIGVGGAEVQLSRYLESCPEGIKPEVLCMSLNVSDVERQIVLNWFPSLKILFSKQGRMNIYRFTVLFLSVFRSKPDIVHTYLDGTAGAFGGVVALLLGKKWMHSSLTLEPSQSRSQWFILRSIVKRASVVIGNAQAIVDKYNRLGVNHSSAKLILNGVDTEKFSPATTAERDLFTFGFLCKHREEKRIDLLLDAVEILSTGSQEFVLLLGGEGPETEKITARILASDILKRHVVLLGLVANPLDFLRSVDVLVMASDSEGTPNSVLEAMSCGVPVVSTDIVNLRNIVERSGWLCERGNADSLASAMKDALSTGPEDLQLRSQGARKYIIDNFDLKFHSGVFWNLHEEVARR